MPQEVISRAAEKSQEIKRSSETRVQHLLFARHLLELIESASKADAAFDEALAPFVKSLVQTQHSLTDQTRTAP